MGDTVILWQSSKLFIMFAALQSIQLLHIRSFYKANKRCLLSKHASVNVLCRLVLKIDVIPCCFAVFLCEH